MAYSVHKRFGRTCSDDTFRAGPEFISPSLLECKEASSIREYSVPLECIIFFIERLWS
jgi:hypothetical protein